MKVSLAIIFFTWISVAGYAQIGFFNSTEIIVGLPEIQLADQQLKSLNDSLAQALDQDRETLLKEFEKHQTDYNNGLLSAKQIQEITQSLQTRQEELNKQEDQFQFRLLQRREELYQPTFDRIDQIVKEIAQEGNYTMIFDSSQQGGYLYLSPSMDITEKIKAKL